MKRILLLMIAVCFATVLIGGCSKNEDDTIKKENPYASSETIQSGDYSIAIGTDNTVMICSYMGTEETELVVPSELDGHQVAAIADEAFSGASQLTKITLPDTVNAIGSYAFSQCTTLTSINIPASLKDIGKDIFADCFLLTEIRLDESHPFLMMKDGAFMSKDKTVLYACITERETTDYSVPEGVLHIMEGAFSQYTKLRTISLPASVTYIASDAFVNCTSLEEIIISEQNQYYTFIDGALFSADMTHLHTYLCSNEVTEYIIPGTVTSIGDTAFAFNQKLTKITIPDSVNYIGSFAFVGCLFTEVTLPDNLTSLSEGAFYNCYLMEELNLPDKLVSIGNSCFAGTSIKRLNLPESLTSIGTEAFYFCDYLEGINFSEGLLTIGDGAFYLCTALGDTALPESLTSIGAYAFAGCEQMQYLNIYQNVKSIGENAFAGCTYLELFAPKGSYAATYATEYQITCYEN